MRNDKIIYKLVVEDIQNVAEETLDRKLLDVEIDLIKESIAERIPWYEAIEDSINYHYLNKLGKKE